MSNQDEPLPINTAIIIDDEFFDQKMYAKIIQRSGLVKNVETFLAADHALEYLKTVEPSEVDAIFLDINLPRMTGFEFLDKAVEILGPDFADICVVMLTTSLNPRDKERAQTMEPIKKFLHKPLSPSHINDVAEIVREAKSSGSAAH